MNKKEASIKVGAVLRHRRPDTKYLEAAGARFAGAIIDSISA